jgi:hypothetical protein
MAFAHGGIGALRSTVRIHASRPVTELPLAPQPNARSFLCDMLLAFTSACERSGDGGVDQLARQMESPQVLV